LSQVAAAGGNITQRGAVLIRLAISVPGCCWVIISDSLTHPVPTPIITGLAAILAEN
jgi:hypothetical protein